MTGFRIFWVAIWLKNFPNFQTVRLLNIYEDWISAFCVLPTELAQNALVVTATFSNQIRLSLFNETTNDFTSDLVDPHQLEFPGWTQAHMIRRSNIDERILLVLSKKACSVSLVGGQGRFPKPPNLSTSARFSFWNRIGRSSFSATFRYPRVEVGLESVISTMDLSCSGPM